MLEVLTRQTGSQHLLAAKNQTKIAHDNAKCPHSCIRTQVNNKLSSQNTVKMLHCVTSNAMCLCAWKMTMCKHKGVCQDLMYKHIVAEIKPSNYFLGKMSHGGTMMVHTQQQILKP